MLCLLLLSTPNSSILDTIVLSLVQHLNQMMINHQAFSLLQTLCFLSFTPFKPDLPDLKWMNLLCYNFHTKE